MAFVTVKKRTVIVVLSIVLALVTAFTATASVIASSRQSNGITIVIDPGHGGKDGGVSGITTGTKESDINLSISKYLAKYLKNAGYNVVLTRSDSASVCGGVKFNKHNDMIARKSILGDSAPDLVVSVHCNSYPMSSVKGAQAFFSAGAISKKFASVVQNYFNDVLNDRPRTAAIGDYYILNCSEYPAVLCECGFLSNADEESKLITASYQQKVAYAIFAAVDCIFTESKQG